MERLPARLSAAAPGRDIALTKEEGAAYQATVNRVNAMGRWAPASSGSGTEQVTRRAAAGRPQRLMVGSVTPTPTPSAMSAQRAPSVSWAWRAWSVREHLDAVAEQPQRSQGAEVAVGEARRDVGLDELG